jgi:hypothetical protein
MANLSITYYPGVNFTFSELTGTKINGSGEGAPGTTQGDDNGEVGGMVTPTGNSYLMMGTWSSPRVSNRSAYGLCNLKYCESITCKVRAGNDSNGHERPNNSGEDFYLAVSDGGFNVLAYSWGSSGSSAYGGGDGAKDTYWESWRDVTVTVPSNKRQTNGYLTFSSNISSSPEFSSTGGVGSANLQNAGDVYALASFTLNLQIPTPGAQLTTNKQYLTVGIDSPTLSWTVSDAESQPSLTEFSTFPDSQLDDPANNNIGSGSGTRVPLLTGLLSTTGTKTYTLSVTNRLSTTTASVDVTVVGVPTATLSINGVSSPNQAEVSVGDSVTLSWTSTWGGGGGLASRSIDNGVGSVAASGTTTKVITTAGLNTFTFTVVNSAGYTVTAVAYVQAYPLPTIDSFSNNPTIPDQDTQFTLTWSTSNATGSVSINQGVGSNLAQDGSVQLTATVPTSGAGSYPGAPTYGDGYRDYTLTACNPVDACVTETLRVYVNPQLPNITLFQVEPNIVDFGGTVTISWTTSYALSGSIDQGVGTATPISSGTKTKTITGNIQDFVDSSSVTFTMSVSGYGGTDSASYPVTVNIDSTPNSWVFSNKTGATINTIYYASSNTSTPL